MTTATLALPGKQDGMAAEVFRTTLDRLTRHADNAVAEARKYRTIERWQRHLRRRISAAAVGTGLLPGLHAAGMLVEAPYLVRLMGRGGLGIGALKGATVEAESDLPAIFALWSGAISKTTVAAAEGGVVIVDSVAYPAFGAKVLALGFKLGVKAAASGLVGGATGTAIGNAASIAEYLLKPIFHKIAAKVSAKVAAKVGAKTVSDFVPLIGATVSVGISLYILNEFLTEATRYYEHKLSDASAR
jgi:hypothetical protein